MSLTGQALWRLTVSSPLSQGQTGTGTDRFHAFHLLQALTALLKLGFRVRQPARQPTGLKASFDGLRLGTAADEVFSRSVW